MGRQNRKISNILVNPKFQLRYVFWVLGTGFFLVTALNAIYYSYIKENYIALVELSPMSDEVRNQLFVELDQLILISLVLSVIFLLLIAIMSLVFSQRVAGPIYHVQRIIGEITSGKTEARIHVRPNDEFQELASEFNQMMDSIVKKN